MAWLELSLPPSLRPAWLGERSVSIPLEPGEEACVIEGPEAPTLGFDLDAAIARLEDERWAAEVRSLTQRLPFAYDRLPWPIRGLGAVAVFATAPATPPAQKSMRKAVTPPFSAGAGAANAPLAVLSG